ncbi:nuclear transport factor 2 family protein [Nonomuraea wenchangensis]|uniref:nuclear transport factor 2 family protein n=1 Tax=Nonomuraea wenchangensis TaxID=568860 RepID=UPI00342E909D
MDARELADRLEIADLLARYTRAVDSGRWERLDEVFTADAVIDYSSAGGPPARAGGGRVHRAPLAHCGISGVSSPSGGCVRRGRRADFRWRRCWSDDR